MVRTTNGSNELHKDFVTEHPVLQWWFMISELKITKEDDSAV